MATNTNSAAMGMIATASYVYNALGERVEEDASGSYTEYVFDKDGSPLGEYNRTSWVDTWIDFEGEHIAHFENNETYFIHSNKVGTAGMVTDYSGAVIQDELHYPWGQVWPTPGTVTEERFASLHHRDSATNLDPTHFRMYSSDTGRWMTPDPAQADIFRPQSMSRYSYAVNNPTALTDPTGLFGYCPYGQTDNLCNQPPDVNFFIFDVSGGRCTIEPYLCESNYYFQLLALSSGTGGGGGYGGTRTGPATPKPTPSLNRHKPWPFQPRWWPSTSQSSCSVYPSGSLPHYVCAKFGNNPTDNSIRGCLQQGYISGYGYIPVFSWSNPNLSFLEGLDWRVGFGEHAYCIPEGIINN